MIRAELAKPWRSFGRTLLFYAMAWIIGAIVMTALHVASARAEDRVVPFKYKSETFFVILHEGSMARGQIDIADHAKRVLYSLPAGACVNCPIDRAVR